MDILYQVNRDYRTAIARSRWCSAGAKACGAGGLSLTDILYQRDRELIASARPVPAVLRTSSMSAVPVDDMRRIADAFPKHRFEVFVLFAKLSPFTEAEIALAKTLNRPYEQRVILLTDRELEPYHLYERTKEELGIETHGGNPTELALVTSRIYFADNPAS